MEIDDLKKTLSGLDEITKNLMSKEAEFKNIAETMKKNLADQVPDEAKNIKIFGEIECACSIKGDKVTIHFADNKQAKHFYNTIEE